MKQYINTSNYYLGALATVINATDETGTFEVDSIENDGVTLPVKGFFWLDVDFDSAGQREIFRIVSRVGTTLTFDKRISPYGKFRHEEGAAVGLRDFAELFNSLASNTDNFGQVEQLSNTTIKVYGGNVYIQGGATRTIPTREVIISPNNLTQFLYFNPFADAGEEFVVTTEQNNSLYHLANITTDTSSITGITDMRGTYIGTSMEGLQTEDNMRSNLDNPNNITYPTTEAVKNAIDDAISHGGGGGGTSLLGGWNAETGLPSDLEPGHEYADGDEFLVDNVKTISYRKEKYGNFHIPTSEDLQTLSSIVNDLLPSSDYSGSYYDMGVSTEFIADVKNILKCPTSSLNVIGVDVFSQTFGGNLPSIMLPFFLFRGNTTSKIDISGYSFEYSNFMIISSDNNITTSNTVSGMGGILGEMVILMGNASAYPVRLFADEAVIPDGTWTVLKSGTGGGGSYWNQNLGLISLSADGTNWITIKDKNVGATEVTPNFTDEASLTSGSLKYSGNYFQLGNCYGFDRYGPFNIQEGQYLGSSIPMISPFNYGEGLGFWTSDMSLIQNMRGAIQSSDWRFIIDTLDAFGITDYHDISRVLMLPLAGYINNNDAVYADGRCNIGGFYWCGDWNSSEYKSTCVLINVPNEPNNDPIWLSSNYNVTEGFNIRGYSLVIEDDTDWNEHATDAITLFDGSSYATGAGIFWSPYCQAIKIYDGTTSLYINDRNGGAVRAFHYGDQLDLDNIGAFYQFGKPIGYFPYDSSVTLNPIRPAYNCSNQRVETLGYKPYEYSSDTFICPITLSDAGGIETMIMLGGRQVTTNNRLREYNNTEYYAYGDNYRPSGHVYNGNPSSEEEPYEIIKGSKYTYLNGEWLLDKATVNFKDIQGGPLDNDALAAELNRYALKEGAVNYNDFIFLYAEYPTSHFTIDNLSTEIDCDSNYISLSCTHVKSGMKYILIIHWLRASGYRQINFGTGINDPMGLYDSFSQDISILEFLAISSDELILTNIYTYSE